MDKGIGTNKRDRETDRQGNLDVWTDERQTDKGIGIDGQKREREKQTDRQGNWDVWTNTRFTEQQEEYNNIPKSFKGGIKKFKLSCFKDVFLHFK